MQYRLDAKSGNQLSALGFGCMRLPTERGKINIDKTEALIVQAVRQGVNYLDTAYIYPGSESALGHILLKNGLRDKVYIATKLPFFLCRSAQDFDKYLGTQLERLQTERIDYYLFHMLSTNEQWERLERMGIREWIEAKKAEGRIGQIGFSFHGKRDDFIALLDAYPWDFCQIQYNYVNEYYQAGTHGLLYAAKKGIPVIIMEPLLGGRLATALPKEAERRFAAVNPDLSPAGWALKWIWNHPEATVVLSGMGTADQLAENIRLAAASAPNSLSQAELQTVADAVEVFQASYKIPCTGCHYCMPCPKNVDIPACFSAYNASFAINKATGRHQYVTGTGALTRTPGYAGKCVKCGKCEAHCPQHIAIRDSLEQVQKKMEPLWFRAMGVGVRLFLRK